MRISDWTDVCSSDLWRRERVSLEANFRLTGRCVGKAPDEAAIELGWPQVIRVDTARSSPPGRSTNGPGGVVRSSRSEARRVGNAGGSVALGGRRSIKTKKISDDRILHIRTK